MSIKTILIITSILSSLFFSKLSYSDTYVNGYYKKNGSYVNGHYRSSKNNSVYDNYSTKGNINPYTGKRGSVNPYRYKGY